MAERSIIVDGGSNNARTLASGDTFALVGRTLFNRYADATTAGTSGDNLYTNSIAANTFISNGGHIIGSYAGSTAANVNEKIWQLLLNSSLIISVSTEAASADWRCDFTIIRVSASVIRCSSVFHCSSVYSTTDYIEITGLSLTDTAYNLILFAETPGAAGDITARMGYAHYFPGV